MTPDRSRTHIGLFIALLDDAAIFPPGNAPMGQAVDAHLVWLSSKWSPLVGPFICASPRWDELLDHLTAESPLRLSLTLSGGSATLITAVERAVAEPRVELASLEVPCRTQQLGELLPLVAEHVPSGTRTYVELPWAQVDDPSAELLARAGVRLKIRTGGTQTSAFPNESQFASALLASITAGVPFKLTAGLHEAIRHRDPVTAFEHHGYLNVICATARALGGHDLGSVTAALAEQNPAAVAEEVATLDTSTARAVREYFVSFGTCSISDPVSGLLDLDLVQEGPQ